MGMKEMLGLLEKLFILLLGLGIVVYVILAFNIWADPLKSFFTLTGNIENFIYISVFLFVLTYVLRKLLLWEVHLLFRQKGRRGKPPGGGEGFKGGRA